MAGITPARRVLIRDLVIFQIKLALDGLKDLVLVPASLLAAAVDLLVGHPRLFYLVLRAGERFDAWLNLFAAAEQAAHSREGLFGYSEPGDPSLLGQLEELSGRATRREPELSRPHP